MGSWKQREGTEKVRELREIKRSLLIFVVSGRKRIGSISTPYTNSTRMAQTLETLVNWLSFVRENDLFLRK